MKSFVTKRSVSVSWSSVSAPPGPLGAFQTLSTTEVSPLQWYWTLSPDTWGNRPVLIAELQTAEKPFTNPAFTWAPVRVMITERLPNGSTPNISPQVISPGCSPADGGEMNKS